MTSAPEPEVQDTLERDLRRLRDIAQPVQDTVERDLRRLRDVAQPDDELYRLREEVTALKSTLADREMALAKAALEAEESRSRWQQESQAALLKAEQAWMAHEAARLAAAEAQWREQSALALAEVTARCEAGEAVLAQLKADAAQERANAGADRLFEAQVNREAEFEQRERERERERAAQSSAIVITPHRIGDSSGPSARERRAAKRYPLRDVLVAASLAVLAVTAYSTIGPSASQNWQRADVNRFVRGFGSIPIPSVPSRPVASPPSVIQASTPPSPAKVAPAKVAPPPDMAVVVRDVNLRANPSNTAAVISALSRGVKLRIVDKRDNWTLVQADGNGSDVKTRLGWVYGSFLKKETER